MQELRLVVQLVLMANQKTSSSTRLAQSQASSAYCKQITTSNPIKSNPSLRFIHYSTSLTDTKMYAGLREASGS
jgi:hypothetical protein